MKKNNTEHITLDPIKNTISSDITDSAGDSGRKTAIPRMTFGGENRIFITAESYKEYGLKTLLANNIFTAVFLISMFVVAFFSPNVLTGNGYIAVISVLVILMALACTVIFSSLISYFNGKRAFIETVGGTPVYMTPEDGANRCFVGIIKNVTCVSVTRYTIKISGDIECRHYGKNFELISAETCGSLTVPRIFENESELLGLLEDLKEKVD